MGASSFSSSSRVNMLFAGGCSASAGAAVSAGAGTAVSAGAGVAAGGGLF